MAEGAKKSRKPKKNRRGGVFLGKRGRAGHGQAQDNRKGLQVTEELNFFAMEAQQGQTLRFLQRGRQGAKGRCGRSFGLKDASLYVYLQCG